MIQTRQRPPREQPPAEPGRLARSLAGSDRGRLYLIQSVATVCHGSGAYVFVCDGGRHGWQNAKRKNLRHLRLLEATLPAAEWHWMVDERDSKQIDGRLRRILARIEQELEQPRGNEGDTMQHTNRDSRIREDG